MASPVLKQILDQSFREKPKSISALSWKGGVRPLESISNCFELFGEIEFTATTVEEGDEDGRDEDAMGEGTGEDGSSKNNSGRRGRKETEIQEQGRGGCIAWGSSYAMNSSDARTAMGSRGGFPPSISTIGRDGKPWLYLKPHRTDGRFVLQVAVVPSHKCLQATRERGRLLLHLSNSNWRVSPDQDDGMELDRNQMAIHSSSNSEIILDWCTETLDRDC